MRNEHTLRRWELQDGQLLTAVAANGGLSRPLFSSFLRWEGRTSRCAGEEKDKQEVIVNRRFLRNQESLGSRPFFLAIMIIHATRKKHEQKRKEVGGGDKNIRGTEWMQG